MQVKLLRFLQEYSFERVGGRQKIRVDLRIISATNSDLKELIGAGRFREDLYYRLDGVCIGMPNLRDRGEDILLMANVFLRRYSYEAGRNIQGFASDAVTALLNYPWPGNIRELINRIRRAVIMADGDWVTPENLELESIQTRSQPQVDGLGLREALSLFESELLSETLSHCQGNVQQAARSLKTSRSVIYHLLKKHGLKNYALIIILISCLGFGILCLKPIGHFF
jgi:two-component system NtrC family response regulator